MSNDFHFNRRSIRLQGYDYSQEGAYFVTICVHPSWLCPVGAGSKPAHFGIIKNSNIVLNEYGKIVQDTWNDLPNHVRNIELDAFVIMPDHIHGIIVIVDRLKMNAPVGAGSKPALNNWAGLEPAPTKSDKTNNIHTLSEIVRQFKTFSAKHINQLRNMPNTPVWQRNFYEHVIRNEASLNQIREYIINNVTEWKNDELWV